MNNINRIRTGLVFLLIFRTFHLPAQIIIEPQLPSQGIIQQTQLWNLLIVNNESNAVRATVQISFQEENNGVKIFTGTSGELSFQKGVSQITSVNVGAIHYEYFNGNVSNMGIGGLLPIGRYIVCYNLNIDKTANQSSEDCLPLTVEPFSPPQLVFPENNSVQNTTYPVLNWLPPMPANMFTNLNYKLIISEVNKGQSPVIAIQRNPLLFVQDRIVQTSFVYPSSYVALQPGKTYAWQILAQNGNTYSQATEVWSFTIHKDSLLIFLDNASYPHLQRGAGTSLFAASEKIKFSYDNEAGDSILTIRILQQAGSSQQLLNAIPVTIKRGVNFIDIDLNSIKKLQQGQDYILELTNGWKENWDLRFRYEPSKQ